ncbi:hypothetical protein CWB99_11440 [Pseudoalteromonas rubra]|uniref:Uncharacterized protein n=1 Tax=Pseudoalteromonas rubra TaxID=43658 RepID=A0A5S3WMG3_9GAMM|nr:hypothetical protein [Pseudoalteromonas rubra]TMP28520.1 hypothetical protein CWB99_11440 [Pseudoalteromonas rubra]TMP30487.1 hypothetical protein CWC00_16560 [Pseudoalteromonas rubra]
MRKEITTPFNIIATIVVWLLELIRELITADIQSYAESETLLNLLFESAVARVSVYFLVWVFAALAIAVLFREIWNRLFSDLFTLRKINFNESYATCILLTWVVLG